MCALRAHILLDSTRSLALALDGHNLLLTLANREERLLKFSRAVDRLSVRPLRVTGPLYRVGVRGQPDAIGSGVLIKAGSHLILASAAHVADHHPETPLEFGVEGGIIAVPALMFFSKVENNNRDDDPIDLAFWVFEPGAERNLKSADYITLDEIDYGDERPNVDQPHVLVVGFPASRQPRARHSAEFEANPLRLAAEELAADGYRQANRAESEYLLADYAKDNLWTVEGRKTGPNLEGVSGSGMWYVRTPTNGSPAEPRLAAIATRWRLSDPKCIIGIRVGALLNAVASRLSGVQETIEQSRRRQLRK